MHLLIIGTGYVGLVTGASFAEMGHHVLCLDIDKAKIEKLQQGILPFYEPGLQELVHKNVEANRLNFTEHYDQALEHADFCFIAVPTPQAEDGSCDLRYVLECARAIALHMSAPLTLVIKSTVPVGTQELVKKTVASILQERGLDISFHVVSNPEFLKEGSAVLDCMKPDRVILGVDNEASLSMMRELYASFTVQHDRIIFMDPRSAELTKYVANAMLATRISFMNEMAQLCELLHADINQVRIGIGSDTRIGYAFLYAGAGFGGSCFPKDISALRSMAKKAGGRTLLIDAVAAINLEQKELLAKKISTHFRGDLNNKTIAIWGLSFKPDTDDMREAPSLTLIKQLLAQGASLRLFDPIAMQRAKEHLGDHPQIYWAIDEYDAANRSDAIALVTEWKQFRFVNFEQIASSMPKPTLFDGRNQYKAKEMRSRGFTYFGIGVAHATTRSI